MNFEIDYNLSKLYKPKDKNMWMMNPHMVNAYYSPSFNEIVFPAGILQQPFFDINNDSATNFGAIGTVIGHEMTHGFDDQGSKFGPDGNLKNWWLSIDKEKYNKKIKILKEQFDNFKIEGEFINGKLTLGENIADLGGVSIAYQALLNYLNKNQQLDIIVDGKTSKERFFISYAKLWRSNTRKKEILKRIITDPHSPPNYRVNGILSNISEFYNIFNLTSKNKLWIQPDKRSHIW